MNTGKVQVQKVIVADIMTKQVIKLNPMTSVRRAIETLVSNQISGAPIVDSNNKVITICSEMDLMKIAVIGGLDSLIGEYEDKLPATKSLVCIDKKAPFVDLFKLFLTRPVRRVLVMDTDGRLEGIVARRDIIRTYVEHEI
jgi:predicted transcriptional regulator